MSDGADNGGLARLVDVQVRTLQAELDRRFAQMESERAGLVAAAREHADAGAAVLSQRLDGIDRATEVLNEVVNRVPTDVQQAVGNQRDVMEEKFSSIATQFAERDTRSERESRDNKVAVDAAFAAQKEAAAKQDESNAKAIDKSERSTTDTIAKLSEQFKSSNDSLGDKIDDLKQRLTSVESRTIGIRESSDDRRASLALYLTTAGVLGGVVSILVQHIH